MGRGGGSREGREDDSRKGGGEGFRGRVGQHSCIIEMFSRMTANHWVSYLLCCSEFEVHVLQDDC